MFGVFDKPARSLIVNINASNGYSSCIKCQQRGEQVEFGSGFHHKIQFGTNLTNDLAYNSSVINDLKKNKDDTLVAKLITLEFAYMCLRNSLNFLYRCYFKILDFPTQHLKLDFKKIVKIKFTFYY